ncbi:hypothetical protein GPAL_0397 [Glaciecola pallidula DSM 14239 = ACAM 615]|uniref:HTH araC/xylS-type domain-containing protein n=1 Tax=Brumicola pallidula DSM 14239 = ACAM 615 TaxID=1121922 RepID=K6ZA85_9ALTE|nr:hypothetical protein GPAL_0397 [Glaciecola pallidula DSM 14239 = ACAM 615]
MRGRLYNRSDGLEPQIWSSVLRSLQFHLAEHNIDTPHLLHECGIAIDDLEHPHGQIPLNRYLNFLNKAAKEADDPLIGIKLSKSIGPELLGALGFLFLSSRTLYDGLDAICQYQNLFQESTQLSLDRMGSHYILGYQVYGMGNIDTRLDVEFSIAYTARLIRLFSNNQVKSVKMLFRHSPSVSVSHYLRLAGLPCEFNQAVNGVSIKAEDISFKGARFDPDLTQILTDYLDADLASKNQVNSFSDQVRTAIMSEQGQETVTAKLIAHRLGVSIPTFFRRLKLENESFKTMLDNVHYELACKYLSETQLNIYQISHLLGFSSTPSFTRAFKKWTNGITPSAYLTQLKRNQGL